MGLTWWGPGNCADQLDRDTPCLVYIRLVFCNFVKLRSIVAIALSHECPDPEFPSRRGLNFTRPGILESRSLQHWTNRMSFTASREYQRAILRPLQLSATVQSAQFPIAQTRFQSETSSAAWRATTHVFTGTEHREVNRAWPPSSFEQDPSAIPDDDKYNVPYDPQSTSGQQGLYHLYDPRDPEKTTEAGRVPPPSLVAKRYIPTYNDAQRARGSTRANLTLLMLPGMGVPKEVRRSHIKPDNRHRTMKLTLLPVTRCSNHFSRCCLSNSRRQTSASMRYGV